VHELLRRSCPFPTVSPEGDLLDGLIISQPSLCRRCKDRECKAVTTDGKTAFLSCRSGFSIAVLCDDYLTIRINGIVEVDSSQAGSHFRRTHKSQKATAKSILEWFQAKVNELAQDYVIGLHDIKRLAVSLLRVSEAALATQSGTGVSEKLSVAPDYLKKIYKSSQILSHLLQFIDVLANPASASYGEKHLQPVYDVLFLLKKVHEDRATERGVSIWISGTSEAKIALLSSFILLPLALIDNAIKYAYSGSQITISVSEEESSILIDVKSFGDLIPLSERESIFEKGYRGRSSKMRGMGIGLYIARLVARANGFDVEYWQELADGDMLRGWNHFTFRIPKEDMLSDASYPPSGTR